MSSDSAPASRLDPRIRRVLPFLEAPVLGDVADRAQLLAEMNSPEGAAVLQAANAIHAFIDTEDNARRPG